MHHPKRHGRALTQGLLEDDQAPAKLHDRILDGFDEFLSPNSADPELYRAAARRATQRRKKLSLEQINRIATHDPNPGTVVPLLSAHQGLDGQELRAALVTLGDPYDRLATPGKEGDVPSSDADVTVVNRLETTGIVKLWHKRSRFTVL